MILVQLLYYKGKLLKFYLICVFRVDVAETIRFLNQGLDFILEGREVTFEPIVFALECLDASEVLAEVVGGQEKVLLVDPGDRLIGVAVEPLKS